MYPKKILIMTGIHMDWLYKQMMPVLREQYDHYFAIICSRKRLAEFKQTVSESDSLIVLEDLLSGANSNLVESSVYELARAYEVKYGITYLMDIIQLCPSSSAHFMGYTSNNIYGAGSRDMVEIFDEINGLFDFFENLFENVKFHSVLVRPKGLVGTVLAYVASRNRVPATFFHSSYFDSDGVWANGPFMGSAYYEELFKKMDGEYSTERLTEPNNVWRTPPSPSLRELIRSLLLLVWNHVFLYLRDLKLKQQSKRVPFLQNFLGEIHKYSVQKYVHSSTVKTFDGLKSAPYLYFALPFEPEYTVQSLCKDFGDTSSIIRQAALSLPAGFKLVLKEHQRIGNRSIEYYKSWQRFPNILIAHPSIPGIKLIEGSRGTITLGGSTPIEAAQMGLPSIIMGKQNPYHFLPSVTFCDNIKDLPRLINEITSGTKIQNRHEFSTFAARFKAAYKTASFDATDTILNRSGTLSHVTKESLLMAVETFIKVTNFQRSNFIENKNNRKAS